jgi:hypothetical protein
MSRTARKLICGCAAVAATLVGAVPAAAAPAPAPLTTWHQADNDDGTSGDTARDDSGDNGLWGLLGLVGLLGLAGLVRRGPKADAMTGYPAASPGTPPANTYPPAEPRRNPPGV